MRSGEWAAPRAGAVFDASEAGPGDVLWIAAAGPLASLLGGALVTALYFAAPSDGVIHDMLWAALLGSVFGVLNLIPLRYRDRRDGPTHDTDGRLILDALRVSRALR